jgi:hypothetical protein
LLGSASAVHLNAGMQSQVKSLLQQELNIEHQIYQTEQNLIKAKDEKDKTQTKAAFAKLADDLKANGDKIKEAKQSLAQIDPHNPTGLEPPPKDWQFELPHQLKTPLLWENVHNEDDNIHRYNPDKKRNTAYAQISDKPTDATKAAFAAVNPGAPTGLEPAPKDW